jgi:hypothetical protein
MSTLHVLDSTGDTTLTWDADAALVTEGLDEGRIQDAEAAFDWAAAEVAFTEAKGLGYRAHKTSSPTDSGNDAEITHKFDGTAAAILMVPQTVGG